MNDADIKRKIVSFRVSDQEYGEIEETSRRSGFATVALFARTATLKTNSSEPMQSPADVEINRLWRRIETLTAVLEKLAADVGAVFTRFHKS